jgi:CRISPR-associated protein Cmr5
MLQTRSQRFAAVAYDRVTQIVTSSDKEKYKAMTRNLPVLIRTAGLAQALAFVEAGKEQMHKELLRHLNETVNEGQSLSEACRDEKLSLYGYMRLTRETLDALVWYKRFAESLLETNDKAKKQLGDAHNTGEKQ